MRYECDIPGFQECFFELSTQWTRGEIKRYMLGSNDAELLAIAAPKMLAIHLVLENGVIASAADLTVENLDQADYRLGIWFAQAIMRELERLHVEVQQAATDWRKRTEKTPAPADRKYVCDLPDYEGCFVQVSDNWSRGDMKRFNVDWGDNFLQLVRSKLVAIQLPGIEAPDQLTPENTDALDYGLWRWLAAALQKGKDDLHSMGEATARRSLGGSAKPGSSRGNQTQK